MECALVTIRTAGENWSYLEMADGKSLFAPRRDGLVFKRVDGKFLFKAISNWYLLKYGNR
jgi:hypothetical protein